MADNALTTQRPEPFHEQDLDQESDEDGSEFDEAATSCRYANRSARFISAYTQGLSGADAAWANKKYHGHHTLPPDMAKAAKNRVC